MMERTCHRLMEFDEMICRREAVSDRLKRVAALAASIAAILFFMLVIGPMVERSPSIQPMAEFIDDRGIEANMYFYTEVESFFDANLNMQNTMDYLPKP